MDHQAQSNPEDIEDKKRVQDWLRDEVTPLAQKVIQGKVEVLSSREARKRLRIPVKD